MARGRSGRGALAAAHLPGRRHAAARPFPDRPRRQDDDRRQMARSGFPGLQRAHRRGRRDCLPAPGRSAHRTVRPGMDRPRRRARLRDQGHLRGDDARVLLAPRVDHRGPARPRGAVRAALRPRAVPARTRAARAGVELRHARRQRRSPRSSGAAQGMGGQARAHARREPGVGRAVGVARRRRRGRAPARPARSRPGPHERARAEPGGAEGGRAGPAGKERLDPRGPGQVPGPGPAPDRPRPGRGRRAARGPRRPGAAVGVRAGGLPAGAGTGRGAARLAARGRAQHLPAARRGPVRHARAAVPRRAHARARARDRRAAHDPRRRRAGARRGPGAARGRAGRTRARRARPARRARTRHARARAPACARIRPPRRWRC